MNSNTTYVAENSIPLNEIIYYTDTNENTVLSLQMNNKPRPLINNYEITGTKTGLCPQWRQRASSKGIDLGSIGMGRDVQRCPTKDEGQLQQGF